MSNLLGFSLAVKHNRDMCGHGFNRETEVCGECKEGKKKAEEEKKQELERAYGAGDNKPAPDKPVVYRPDNPHLMSTKMSKYGSFDLANPAACSASIGGANLTAAIAGMAGVVGMMERLARVHDENMVGPQVMFEYDAELFKKLKMIAKAFSKYPDDIWSVTEKSIKGRFVNLSDESIEFVKIINIYNNQIDSMKLKTKLKAFKFQRSGIKSNGKQKQPDDSDVEMSTNENHHIDKSLMKFDDGIDVEELKTNDMSMSEIMRLPSLKNRGEVLDLFFAGAANAKENRDVIITALIFSRPEDLDVFTHGVFAPQVFVIAFMNKAHSEFEKSIVLNAVKKSFILYKIDKDMQKYILHKMNDLDHGLKEILYFGKDLKNSQVSSPQQNVTSKKKIVQTITTKKTVRDVYAGLKNPPNDTPSPTYDNLILFHPDMWHKLLLETLKIILKHEKDDKEFLDLKSRLSSLAIQFKNSDDNKNENAIQIMFMKIYDDWAMFKKVFRESFSPLHNKFNSLKDEGDSDDMELKETIRKHALTIKKELMKLFKDLFVDLNIDFLKDMPPFDEDDELMKWWKDIENEDKK